jgi:hypothetical protein
LTGVPRTSDDGFLRGRRRESGIGSAIRIASASRTMSSSVVAESPLAMIAISGFTIGARLPRRARATFAEAFPSP